jgi:hypothetical protein
LTFDEAIEASSKDLPRSILLGNGFSVAQAGSQFDYAVIILEIAPARFAYLVIRLQIMTSTFTTQYSSATSRGYFFCIRDPSQDWPKIREKLARFAERRKDITIQYVDAASARVWG